MASSINQAQYHFDQIIFPDDPPDDPEDNSVEALDISKEGEIEATSDEPVQSLGCCSRAWNWIKEGTKTTFKAGKLAALTITGNFGIFVSFHRIRYIDDFGKEIVQEPLISEINLGQYVSPCIREVISKTITEPAMITKGMASFFLPSIGNSTDLLYGCAVEEIICRGLIQEGLLRRLPHRALQKIAPDYAHLTDHPIARISRVALASLVFALVHVDKIDSPVSVLPQFCSGLIFGTTYEMTRSLKIPILTHFFVDAALGIPA